MPDELHDPQLGISIRFIQHFDPSAHELFTEQDSLLWQHFMRQCTERQELERLYALPSPPEDR